MLRIITDWEEAQQTLTRSGAWTAPPLSPRMARRIQDIFGRPLTAEQAVAEIVAAVREGGDAALREYAQKIEGQAPALLEVPAEEVQAARQQIPPSLLEALELAAQRIRSFHQAQRCSSWVDFNEGGLGQIIQPLERVGIYIPGGTAAYPSTVLMTVIPAKVAGVKEVSVATPPSGSDGILPATMAVAHLAGADRVFQIGGAQAIAALAYGTESVPKVDKICGPGNIFVTLAKKQVYGVVDIDGLHGPTETLIIADETANPVLCAIDLLAQAEHDEMASAVLVTSSMMLLRRVIEELRQQLASLERRETAQQALEHGGIAVVVSTIEQAIALANRYAPEHLCLMLKDPWAWVSQIKNAGGIFLGESSPEALGDYIAGPSHVMPTGGSARFGSPLNVWDFLKITNLVALDRRTAATLASPAAIMAWAEGLTAHARAIELHFPPNPS